MRAKGTPGLPHAHRKAYELAEGYGVGWLITRVAISEQYRCPPPAVRRWPLRDVIEAHAVLDLIETLTPDPKAPPR